MTAIIDYGCGNLFSLAGSLKHLGIESVVTGDAEIIRNADRIILPGVGAFGDASIKLKETGLGEIVKEEAAKGKPVLGICLGMQLLFDKSFEYGEHDGLGLISGEIKPFKGIIDHSLKIPHMGWNKLNIVRNDPIFKNTGNGDYVYFVHSFFATDCSDSVLAYAEYGTEVPAVVASGNVYGMQFHPEKSGERGLALLKAFCSI